MGRIVKRAALLLLGLVLLAPVAIAITLFTMPLWTWIELNYQIESVGHSGPAEWCYLATYAALVTVSLAAVALLYLTRGRSQADSSGGAIRG